MISGAKVVAIVIMMTILVTSLLLRQSRFVTVRPPENALVSDDVNITGVLREIDHSVRCVRSLAYLLAGPNICHLSINIPSRSNFRVCIREIF